MIPIKLSLRNFMPYREAFLSFEGIHIACLCGDNGNGKSALLDAITWALWGKARSRSDDELIHLGTAEMQVEFEFCVGQKHYRAIRKRSKPKASRGGQSLLDFQIATNGTFKSIAGNSIAETEHKIVDVLHMDYDTFINSAYIMQGRADEFTKAQPAKRKEVLANILGLSRYDELETKAKELAKQKGSERRDLENAIVSIDEELANKGEYEAQLQQTEKAIAEAEKERQEYADIVNGLIKQKNALESKREQHANAEERINQAKETVKSFENQIRERRLKVDGYEKVLANYEQERSATQAHIDEMTQQEAVLGEKRAGMQDLSNRIYQLSTANAQLKREMEELRGKIDMLAQEEANCPLCGNELGAEGRDRIMANYEEQGNEKKQLFRSNEDTIRKLEKEQNVIGKEINRLENTIKEGRTRWERRAEVLERERDEADTYLPKEREGLLEAERNLERWRASLETDIKDQRSLQAEFANLPELETKLNSAQQTLDELTGQQAQKRQTLGKIQASLDRCSSLEKNRAQKSHQLKIVAEEEEIYQTLAVAFSKKGIQAMLIENALPEIEEEANRLLARMTDNRMHIKIETQRSRKVKQGEPVETLDINISDDLGARRYEMYSGGEAFRIDFALRIALSRLLAHRAGAPLPTLIIDEGFGSQDVSGRERLVEAINSIQGDFEKVLVITHIEELKEAFPVRIEVDKTPDGSVIRVT